MATLNGTYILNDLLNIKSDIFINQDFNLNVFTTLNNIRVPITNISINVPPNRDNVIYYINSLPTYVYNFPTDSWQYYECRILTFDNAVVDDTFFNFITNNSNPLSDFNFILYKSSAENNRVDKTNYMFLVSGINGVLRESTSVVRPIITIEYNKIPDFNYVFYKDTNRYYFVDEVVSVNTNLWELHLSVDVLMTYKSQIVELEAFVDRNQFDFNPMVIDDRLIAEQGQKINIQEAENIPIGNLPIDTLGEDYSYALVGSRLSVSNLDYPTTGTPEMEIVSHPSLPKNNIYGQVEFISKNTNFEFIKIVTTNNQFPIAIYYSQTYNGEGVLVYQSEVGWIDTAYQFLDFKNGSNTEIDYDLLEYLLYNEA